MIGLPRPSPTTDEVTPEQRDHLKGIRVSRHLLIRPASTRLAFLSTSGMSRRLQRGPSAAPRLRVHRPGAISANGRLRAETRSSSLRMTPAKRGVLLCG